MQASGLHFLFFVLWYALSHIIWNSMKNRHKQIVLAKELAGLCGMVRGSVVHTKRKCGRPGCECSMGKLHPFCYLSRSSSGSRNKILYVKPSEEKAFDRASKMYERAWAIIEELTELNIKEIKENGYDGRRTEHTGGKKAFPTEG
jgi:hypothetical protein